MSFVISPIGGYGSGHDFRPGSSTEATSLSELAPHYRELIDGPVTVTLATHARDGHISLSPVWMRAAADGERLELNSSRGRLKDRQIRRDPRVSIQATNPADPYHWITIHGTVDDIYDEEDPQRGHLPGESLNAMSKLYIGQDTYPMRSPGEVRVVYLVRPERVLTFGEPG
jgi:PPOX class probable F420-dependent enzyme